MVKNGLPVPAAKITTRPFSRWRIGAAADVGLGDLADLDRRHHPRVRPLLLERVLQGQGVEHGREHPHVVGGRAVHPRGRPLQAAVDVARADDDRDLESGRADLARPASRSAGPGRGRSRTRARPSGPRPRASAGRGRRPARIRSRRSSAGRLPSESLALGLGPDFEAGEAGDPDVLAGLRRSLLAKLLDRLAVVLVAVDVRLLEQRDLLAPLGELALDDPLADVLGLALLGGLLLEDGRARRASSSAGISSAET